MGRILDANNPDEVASATKLEVDVGTPDRKLVVLSGIAIPEWEVHDDGTDYRDTYTVNLRYPVLAVDQATLTVGLASIGNGKTNFLFGCDASRLEIDDTTQELLLHVDLANRGDPSALNRFGYQVVVTAVTTVTGISGTILWERSIFDPTELSTSGIAQLFQVSANTFAIEGPPDGFKTEVLTPVAYGVTDALTTAGNDYVMPYRIPGAPFNTPLKVAVKIGSGFVTSGYGHSVGQIAGPSPLTLTPVAAGVDGVNFRVTRTAIPR